MVRGYTLKRSKRKLLIGLIAIMVVVAALVIAVPMASGLAANATPSYGVVYDYETFYYARGIASWIQWDTKVRTALDVAWAIDPKTPYFTTTNRWYSGSSWVLTFRGKYVELASRY